MIRKTLLACVLAGSLLATIEANAAAVMVGGQPMFPSKTIVENAVNSADHTTLVAAVKAAGLVETLKGKGPFTVFAPVNAAFSALPDGTVDMLLKPENKDKLIAVLQYHVIPGTHWSKEVASMTSATSVSAPARSPRTPRRAIRLRSTRSTRPSSI